MPSKIQCARQSIDKVDREIVKLINKRAELALEVAREKSKNGGKGGGDIYVPSREKEVLKNVIASKKVLGEEALRNIYTEIISACRNLESPTKIAFLGPWATFTHQAAIKNFGSTGCFIPVGSPTEVMMEVESGRAEFGVVPVENSNEGSVNVTLDILVETELKICGEISLKIEQCFIGKDREAKIMRVYSHPHALAQCRNWINRNYPEAELIPVSSTAEAAKKVAKEDFAGAIAGEAAAKIYDLCILKKGIQDSRENFTRFFVLGKISTKPSGKDKTSLVFTVKDKVGALYNILGIFNKNNVNLAKIESRPTKKRAWEYMFFVDFKGHVEDANIAKTIESLERSCILVKSLGSYQIT
ncbi:prephenate dehydratase [Candidatus Endomicrobiellum agilis]|uniref:prephenate dehydratase n=1 Tax=Candidatus Endomicrobiellum agilis TaxID=3238957 RepID=UPI003577296F|nr:prephenate dehydratase [Endomicrobium sp.]